MVSKALASLDAWLALAEEVLAEPEASSGVPARDHDGEPVDPTSKERAVSEVTSYVDNAGFQAWNMSKGIAAARAYAGQARELLIELEAADDISPDRVGEARRIVEEIERIAVGGDVVWERIEAALGDAGLVDPAERRVTVIRNGGAQPELTRRLWELWRDFEGRTAALTLLGQLEEITGPGRLPSDHLWRPPSDGAI